MADAREYAKVVCQDCEHFTERCGVETCERLSETAAAMRRYAAAKLREALRIVTPDTERERLRKMADDEEAGK